MVLFSQPIKPDKNRTRRKKKIDIEKAKQSCVKYYDSAHQDYHDQYRNELSVKPYDKEFLTRFSTLIQKDAKVLDIGCSSSAQQAQFFRDTGFKTTSIDLSEKCIATAKANFKGIHFLQMDMLEMNFESDTFDAINAFYSIIHIPDEKIEALFFDLNRILKFNGKLAIAVHAGDFSGFFEENGISVFYQTYTHDKLKYLIDKFGFRMLEIQERQPIYDFEFQTVRIYLMAEKTKTIEPSKPQWIENP